MRKTNRGTKTWLAALLGVLATDGLTAAQAAAQSADRDCARYSVGSTGAHRDFVFGIYADYNSRDHGEAGVRIAQVSRDGAAEAAGLRAGDVVTAVAGRDVTAASAQRFNAVLGGLDIEEGDAFEFEVLRGDEVVIVEIVPQKRCKTGADMSELERRLEAAGIAFDGFRITADRIRSGVDTLSRVRFWLGRGVAGLELLDLNPDLGAYFGVETGVLVVEADEDSWTGLRGGDVVTHVDGRPVEDVAKLRRIMRSYDEGEEVRFHIRRDGGETTVVRNMK